MEAFREFEVVWWVLLNNYLAGFRRKKILLRVAGGADHQQDPNNTFCSLKASMSAAPASLEALRMSKVLWWVLLRVISQSPKNMGCRGARIIIPNYRSGIWLDIKSFNSGIWVDI